MAIWVVRRGRVTVENINLIGARVPDRNGAGIRFEGVHLTVRRCLAHKNPDRLRRGANGPAGGFGQTERPRSCGALEFAVRPHLRDAALQGSLTVFISTAQAQTAPAAATGGTESTLYSLLPLVLMFVVLYFIMIRPNWLPRPGFEVPSVAKVPSKAQKSV